MTAAFRVSCAIVLATLASLATAQNLPPGDVLEGKRPNILLLIGDDMGNETLSCYGWSENPAKTPTLDELSSKLKLLCSSS